MTIEERLRDRLTRDAESVPEIEGWDGIVARLDRPVAKHGRTALVAAAAALLLAALGVRIFIVDDHVRVATDGVEPSSFVSTTEDGVAEVSTANGEVVRTIVLDDAHDYQELTLSPDRETVYVSRNRACEREIVAVPRSGGAPRTIGRGAAPSVSPDGRQLASVEHAVRTNPINGYRGCAPDALLVRDLATGRERRWDAYDPDPANPPFNRAEPWALAWAADSRSLAFGTQDGSLWVLDTTGPGERVQDARQLARRSRTTQFPIFRPGSNDLLVGGRGGLVRLDPRTGATLETLIDEGNVVPLSFDASGRHLLFAWGRPDFRDGGVLYRWSGGVPVLLSGAAGFVAW